MPAVGVRFSDAQAFCEWLTRRSLGRWRYRLPQANDLGPNVTDSQTSLPPGIGCWTCMAGGGQYVGCDDQGATVGNADLGRWVSRDVRIAHDLILDHGRDWNVARGLDLHYELALDLDPARDLCLDLDLTRASARDQRRQRTLARERAQALALLYARDVALNCTHDHDRDLDPIHAQALRGVRDMAQALDLTKDRGLHCDPNPAWKSVMILVRQAVRLDALALIIGLDVLLRAHNHTLNTQPGSVRMDARMGEIGRLERQLLGAYIDLCILEDRIEGRLPAVEGIRIVQEREKRQVPGK